jgi:simple sugar transport system permease protein
MELDWLIILASGVATGTVLLYATVGEIYSERSGVLNLGVEGMMLVGAMSAYKVSAATNNAWLGLLVGMIAAGLISQVHAFIAITLQADQVVSGLSLNFLATGISLVLGEGLTSLRDVVPALPSFSIPLLSGIPWLGKVFLTNQSIMVYIGFLFIPLAWYYINRTRPGMHLRAVGEYPAAADTLGIRVYAVRYFYVFVGGLFAGLAGATISLSISPGWFGALTTAGQGWIAVGLVIFAQWDPIRAAFGSYIFGALRRLVLDIQGPATLFGFANPFFLNSNLGFFMKMLPYAFTVLVLVIGSREATRKRIGTPAALGLPYIRGQRGL